MRIKRALVLFGLMIAAGAGAWASGLCFRPPVENRPLGRGDGTEILWTPAGDLPRRRGRRLFNGRFRHVLQVAQNREALSALKISICGSSCRARRRPARLGEE